MVSDNCCKFKVSNQNIYKQLSLCSPRVKLLKFSIWQMISASFLMRSKKNLCLKFRKMVKDTVASPIV